MAFEGGKKKKITVIALVTILLVAAIVGTIVTVRRNKPVEIDLEKAGGMKTGLLIATAVTATTVIILCKYTDFRDICRETLDRIRTGIREPRELIKAGFHAAIENIQIAIDKSFPLRQVTKDPMAAMALDQCNELLNISIEDLKRSIDRFSILDVTRMKDNTIELRVWLSGAVTYQSTCLDAFENTTSEAGASMTRLLDLGHKLTRNSLAMIDGVIELSGGAPPRRFRPRTPRQVPGNTVINWKIDRPEVPEPKPKNVIVDWKVNGPEDVPQPKPKNVIVDWKVEQPEVPQPKPKNVIVDWKVNRPQNPQPKPKTVVVDGTIDGPKIPQPKPKSVQVDWKVDDPEVQPKPKAVNVDWKTDVTISHSHSRTVDPKDPKSNMGNRRMLDQSSNDEEPGFDSKLQMFEDTSNEETIPIPDSKPIVPNELNTPSWTDSSRRSLINADPQSVKPNAVVAQDGSGQFKTISEAVNTAPQKSQETFIILIKAGTYNEYVTIPRHVNNVVFLGEGPTKTKITGNKNFIDGVATYHTATVAVNGDGFMAKDIAFENSAGPEKHQAVALRVSADMTIFHNCIMDGFQDTLYTHSYRQFYRQCNISGTVDFIFGNAAAVFQDCRMIVRKPMSNQACMVTAQGRKDQHSVGGLVLDGCMITAEPEFLNSVPMPKSYLGRPWKEFSRTIIMQSFIDKNIVPEGWSPWTGTFGQDTCYYAEVNNKGPGADTSKRVTWKGIKKISQTEAQSFAPGIYIQGDSWIKASNVPYDAGLMRV